MFAIAAGFRDAAVVGTHVVVAVSEAESRLDLNADGDQNDQVAQEVDVATGAVVNLRVAVSGAILASDKHFAFLASEAAQGLDLNGDGDLLDFVWHVYDPMTPAVPPVNLGIATNASGIAGAGTSGGFVLLQAESASAGVDLNGDGDAADVVARVFDGAAFVLRTMVLGPHAPGTPLIGRNGRVLFASSEAALGPTGTNMNGDLDTADVVLGFVDFAPGLPVFVSTSRAVAGHPYALTDNAAVYLIDEASQGAMDMNNDGDAIDAILAVWDISGGTLETRPLTPLLPSFTVAVSPSLGIAAGKNRIVVGVGEAANGNRDLNVDGDATDHVVGWVDTTAPAQLRILPFPFGLKPAVIDGVRGIVAVSEGAMGFGGTDLNSDFDVSDDVAYLLDTTTPPGTMTSLGRAVNTIAIHGDDALLGVSEANDKGIDLNGDSVADDTVLRYVNLAGGANASRNLAIVSAGSSGLRASSLRRLSEFSYSETPVRRLSGAKTPDYPPSFRLGNGGWGQGPGGWSRPR
jgi:hypothetical protein